MFAAVRFYDATLTAGLWQQGHRLPAERRRALAQHLDSGRVDYLEVAVWDPNAQRLTWMVEGHSWRYARPVVRVPLDGSPEANGARVRAALQAETPVVAVQISAAAEPEAWAPALQALAAAGREVIAVLEDFVEVHRRAGARVWQPVAAAVEAGAQGVTLGDATGQALPWEMATLMHEAVRRFPETVLGVRSGNANACADDNTLAAVRQGARLVHGTLHGHGQGQGFADLTHVRAALFRENGAFHDDADTLRALWEVGQTLDHWLYA